MRILILLSILTICTLNLLAQKATYVYRDYDDSSVNCYLKIVPKDQKIKGIVIRDYTSLPPVNRESPYKIHKLVVENGFVMLYSTTSKVFPQLGYTDAPIVLLDEIVNEVIVAHNIPKNNVFVGGMSASGTRALQYSKFCEQGKSKFGIKIKGIFVCDPPLDFERFYFSAKNNGSKFKAGMAEEAELMMRVFPEQLGTPQKNLKKYRSRSIYSQFAKDGGNAIYFKKTPIVLFHEPDMDWWAKERGCSYYDINSFDITGFANQISKLGNNDVSLVTTSGKGYQNGIRKCHSWSIVNEAFLMQWILDRTE